MGVHRGFFALVRGRHWRHESGCVITTKIAAINGGV